MNITAFAKQPLNIAVIGSGGIAIEHINALVKDPRVNVKYVVSRNAERARTVAGYAPGAVGITDQHTAFNDPDIFAVNACGWTPDHAPVTIAAGNAGKHVLVEKPAALTVDDFDAMVAATEGQGRTLMVGQTVRFQPSVSTLQSRVACGAIGDPRLVHITWYTGHVWPNGWRGWQHDLAHSGGHPVHNGTHALDLATWLIGKRPVRVFTRDFASFAADMPMPDSFQMMVKFEDGSLATIELCYALSKMGQSLRRIVVAGTGGTLSHNSDNDPYIDSQGTRSSAPSLDNAMQHQIRHWVDMLEAASMGKAVEPIVKNHQVRAALAAAIAAQRALESREPQSVDAEQVSP